MTRGASPWEEKSPRKHSIASLTHSTLGITLPLESMSVFVEDFCEFVESSRTSEANRASGRGDQWPLDV